MGKVRLNKDNKINEGILGFDDLVFVTPDRGFSDRSVGDEFPRLGRNGLNTVIENPDLLDAELTDDEFEDTGYDYDGGDVDIDDEDSAGYTYHPDVRDQLYNIDQRLTGLENMLTDIKDLFGSRGTPSRPI